MESESINSSKEVVDHSWDEESKDLGVGRSYECVFCKRGFNTAQALGGHMNIHRKDRARNKPTNSNPRLMIPSTNYHHHQPLSTYFPAASTSTSTPHKDHYPQPSDHLNPGSDWRMRLSLEDLNNNKEKDLDLELRLGYH